MRVRVSTTVDEDLLAAARNIDSDANDATVLDRALAALVERHRHAQIDAGYSAYEAVPLSKPDDWGDLQSFREAAGNS